MKKIILASILLLGLTLSNCAQDVGDDAPDFTLTGLDGQSYNLSDYEGKVVYLFLFGAECPSCRQNGPLTQTQIYEEFESDTNFVALGIDTWNRSAATVNAFKNQTGITYPLLLNGASVLNTFNTTYDRNLVIGHDGSIVYKGRGLANSDIGGVVNAINSELDVIVSNKEVMLQPTSISLNQNYPNPFNPSTTIPFSLNQTSDIAIQVIDMMGRVVSEISKNGVGAGEQTVTFDASRLASGVYMYRLMVNGSFVSQKKMTLLK